MPAHIRSALMLTQLSIPVVDGRLALGAWQGVYLFEHRSIPHRRGAVLHLIGEQSGRISQARPFSSDNARSMS